MIVYSLVFFTLLLALVAIIIVWRGVHALGKVFPYQFVSGLAVTAFVFLYGAWVYLSVYGKYVFAVVVLITGLVAFGKRGGRIKVSVRRKGLFIAITVVCLILDVLYFTGTAVHPYATVELALPFKNGRYFVLQGGRGLPTNVMHASKRGAFAYAMDIVKLNALGNRANTIFSKRLTDYEIFGDTIYSPCSGFIMHSMAENPDNIPPNAIRGKFNTNGVVIENPEFYVCMVHMKYHTVFVKEGDFVKVGQPLGCAGNSGKSIEPHLHIQAHTNSGKGIAWYLEPPLEMSFNKQTYRLFDVIDTP